MTQRLLFLIALFCGIDATLAKSPDHGFELPNNFAPGAVIYGVVPTLYGHQPLADVTARLDSILELGADVIWLSPIMQSDDTSAISYAPTDFFKIRPDFGTDADLKTLVAEATRRKMRVILDFVANHTSTGHPFYQDMLKMGRESPYYDYYDRDAANNVTHYFDWEHLPNLNFNNANVRQMIGDAFKHWVNEFGVSGFRVDAAWGIRRRAPDFWPRLLASLERTNPGLLMLAEASARDGYYRSNGFDLAYDWTEKLGEWSWSHVFEEPKRAGAVLARALAHEFAHELTSFRTARFLNNNDTGKRFITRYGVRLTRVAAVLQHTLPGVPIVYAGDEIGAEYDPGQDPAPLNWQLDPHELRPLYKKLIALRKQLPQLASGEWMPIPVGSTSAFAFLRFVDERDPLLVVLNFGQAAQLELKIPLRLRASFKVSSQIDVLAGSTFSSHFNAQSGVLTMEMKNRSAVVLRSKGMSDVE